MVLIGSGIYPHLLCSPDIIIYIRWTLKATHEKDFADFPATHNKFETQGADIFHFEGDKIKEAWTVCDMAVLAQ